MESEFQVQVRISDRILGEIPYIFCSLLLRMLASSIGCSRKHTCVDQPDLCLNPKGSAPKRKGFSKL